ncbi:SDR family NAD(P)-dependent oxidoreductase [Pimelobacter sp. 30-1]|uniref:SDR family NAD(P)-dependent oxidoreductase n=1 Tax=Pimelobacter sp. 30-1 TaxID=2004991 RepID=UPI001C051F8D|nr:SDR family oxidoreductase [Pimelobacter sp. 30-1]MBU2694747.1 hypothetical protein [Pimelobacter sp. 30-1]
MSDQSTTPPHPRFAGRRVIVTGAAGGIGRAVADLFRAEGARVVGTDLAPAAGRSGPDDVVPCDLTDDAARDEFVAAALAELGGLDVLCHVAGVQRFAPIGTLTPELLRLQLDVNALAPIMITQGCADALAESGGNVVAVASIAAVTGQPYNAAYCASKAALLLGMRSLAIDLGTREVRVNCVSPGGVDTPLIETALASLPPDADPALISRMSPAVPGLMAPDDIAAAVLYLASDAAASVTGANLVVDRGTLW